jgi:hypothetical protein
MEINSLGQKQGYCALTTLHVSITQTEDKCGATEGKTAGTRRHDSVGTWDP